MELRTDGHFKVAVLIHYTVLKFIWLGANDRDRGEGNWIWDSNKDEVKLGTEYWAKGRPTIDDKRNCLVLQNEGLLVDKACSFEYDFVCEYI